MRLTRITNKILVILNLKYTALGSHNLFIAHYVDILGVLVRIQGLSHLARAILPLRAQLLYVRSIDSRLFCTCGLAHVDHTVVLVVLVLLIVP